MIWWTLQLKPEPGRAGRRLRMIWAIIYNIITIGIIRKQIKNTQQNNDHPQHLLSTVVGMRK